MGLPVKVVHRCEPPHGERAGLGAEWTCPECGLVWNFKISFTGADGRLRDVTWMAKPFPWWASHDDLTCPLCSPGMLELQREVAHEYTWRRDE